MGKKRNKIEKKIVHEEPYKEIEKLSIKEKYDINEIIKKYSNELEKIEFHDDALDLDFNELISGCKDRLDSINNIVKEILIIKLLLNIKGYNFENDLKTKIDKRIENELKFIDNNEMEKLFKESDKSNNIDEENYIENIKINKEADIDVKKIEIKKKISVDEKNYLRIGENYGLEEYDCELIYKRVKRITETNMKKIDLSTSIFIYY